MSLVGNLEDLGLGDILQIVSLSRKSGALILQSQNREGKVVFQNGQVIRATSTVFRDNLGDLLVRRGIVDLETIKQALLMQRSTRTAERIGAILVSQFGVAKETIDTIVREQIEKIVYSFFAWDEGTFAFELGESGELASTCFDPLQFMLDQGLNPQWLAMEGSRLLDEKLHRGESLEDEAEPPLIDIEALFGDESLLFGGEEGGAAVNAASAPPAVSSAASGFNLGAEMRLEFGETAEAQRLPRGPESPGLFLLRGMLQELHNPALGGGIILLVLRFASELMNRAVIFLVKEDEIVGLGQFGIESIGGDLADVRIRRMRIPRHEGSVFESVLDNRAPVKTRLGNSRWDLYLSEHLGGQVSDEIFLGPIISEGKVVAILYGDNVPERNAIGDTETLEIFLSQAGLAMEKALLERRLRSREISV